MAIRQAERKVAPLSFPKECVREGSVESDLELFRKYLGNRRDTALRNELIGILIPFIRKAAGTTSHMWGYNSMFGRGDAESEATIGMIDALSKYDPSLGSFSAYAHRRMTGQIVDALRSMHSTGRNRRYDFKSLGAPITLKDGDVTTLLDLISSERVDHGASTEESVVGRVGFQEALGKIRQKLDSRRLFVLEQMLRGRTRYGISEDLGVTASRVSQLMPKIREAVARALNVRDE